MLDRLLDALLKVAAAIGLVAVSSTIIAASACVVIDPDAQLCAVGEFECACTLGGSCDGGLVCDAGMCVAPDSSTSSTSSASTNPTSADPGTSSDASTNGETSETTGPAPQPQANLAFVTSARYSAGALGGLAGADSICQGHAESAGLPGTFRAWLSVPGDDARDRLGDGTGWVRPDAAPLASSLQQLQDGHFYYPPVLDENGGFVAPDFAWTGTFADGTANSVDEFGVCGGWTLDEPNGFAWIGDLGAGPGWWTAYGTLPCASLARLICLGVDQQYDLVVEPTPGRLAFVSAGYVPPTGGRDEADALCQAEAVAAGADGSFLAFMAVNGEAPADRFDPNGAPWVRSDGIPLFTEGAPLGATLATPLLYDASGNPTSLAIAWAGSYAAHAVGSDTANCTNWTSTMGTAGMFATIHIFWEAWALGGGSQECAQFGYSVLCFEQ